MSEKVYLEKFGHVAVVKFENPPTNYATVGLLGALADHLQALDSDKNIRAIILASSGNIFCAGADLISPNGFGASSGDPLREFYDQVLRLFTIKKPVVAAIQGAAIGAGLGLAVFADFRIASPKARFSANFVKLGFHPGFALTLTLPRLLGAQRASQMFLTAKRYKPEEVLGWGLIDQLVETEEKLMESALAFAQEIAVNAPLGLLATRGTLRMGLCEQAKSALIHEHQEQLKLQDTEDFAEGRKAVAERRPGNFKAK